MPFLSPILSFLTSKTGIILISILLIAGSTAFAVNKYNSLQTEIVQLQTDKSNLESEKLVLSETIKNKDIEINSIKSDYEIILSKNKEYANYSNKLEEDKQHLLDLLHKLKPDGSERDFGKIAAAKSKMVENLINKGTDQAFRCIEIASGDKITPGETNNMCPVIIQNNK